jgi:DNA-directed RNA polymerase specialized sigma24 family protein
MNASDADYLVGRLAMGDRAALGELSARWRRSVLAYLARRTQLKLDFEHLAGLTFDKVVRYAPSYIAQGRFAGWLFSIARNVLLDEIKRYNRERERGGLWYVGKHGSLGTHASTLAPAIAPDDRRDEGGDVVDVSFHARGIDMSVRFSPGELRRKGYSVPKEIRRMFRRFGLVDGPTPEIWKKSYTNMKINESETAFGGVIPVERSSSPILNGASHPFSATELPLPTELIQDKSITTCCVCARRTKCEPVGADFVCRRCEREAASNWFTARQLAVLGAQNGRGLPFSSLKP